jgi:hypothetical protein
LFEVLNADAAGIDVGGSEMKNVPGRRKTDRLDCQWLQKLHACGLLSASFRPSPEICRLRTCLRHRSSVIWEQSRHIQRMQKALREMNVLLDQAVSDVTGIPGIGESTAQGLISEIGLDMSRWPTAKHFVSWLDLCPSPKVSGGRVIGQGRRHAANRAAQMFRQAASSLKSSPSWLGAFYRRMRARLGGCAAVKATAHKLALLFYRMMSTRTEYRQIGASQYEERFRQRAIHNLQRRARQLGLELTPRGSTPALVAN